MTPRQKHNLTIAKQRRKDSIPAVLAPKAEAGAPDDDLAHCEVALREFCAWLGEKELSLCSVGYAGEAVDIGDADRFLDIYLASRR